MKMRIFTRRMVGISSMVVVITAVVLVLDTVRRVAPTPIVPAGNAAPVVQTIAGITMPVEIHKLSFLTSGVVGAVAVKPGDVVKKGQELMSLDTDLEQVELKRLQIVGQSTQQIQGETKDRDSKKLEADSKEEAYKTRAVGFTECEQAKLAYEIAVVKVQMAEEEHQVKALDAGKQAVKVEKMRISSPVDGIVQDVILDVGEVVDPNKPEGAIVIVKNDPLKVRIYVPSAQGVKLKLKDTLRVAYADQPEKWMTATVTYMSPVVDSASDTREVRLEMSNTDNRPAGLQVIVKLPEELAAQ